MRKGADESGPVPAGPMSGPGAPACESGLLFKPTPHLHGLAPKPIQVAAFNPQGPRDCRSVGPIPGHNIKPNECTQALAEIAEKRKGQDRKGFSPTSRVTTKEARNRDLIAAIERISQIEAMAVDAMLFPTFRTDHRMGKFVLGKSATAL